MIFQIAAFPEEIRDYMVKVRRHLHAYPELSLKEEQTRDYILGELDRLGISHQVVGTTGVLGQLKGQKDGRKLLIRCETDALPLTEETGYDFSSTNEGVMHACGHDAHMAVVLGLAKFLVEKQVVFSGTILFLFQPAEEIGAGARMVLEDFDRLGIRPDECISVHTGSELPLGKISIKAGPVMAGTRTMKAMIRGEGGHASRPDVTIDPISAMLSFLTDAQRLKDRTISPFEDAVLSFTGVHAGTKTNIVPETCEVWASMRFFKDEVGEQLKDILTRSARATEIASGVTIDLVFSPGVPPVVNDRNVIRKLTAAAEKTFGRDNILSNERLMASDDFGRYLERWPGAYTFAGSGSQRIEIHPGHSPRYAVDEEVMVYIVTYYLNYIAGA